LKKKNKTIYSDYKLSNEYGAYNRVAKTTADNLSKLNTSRGGVYGTKGFVAEHKIAEEMNKTFIKKGISRTAEVVDNNGLADIIIKNKHGHVVGKQQVKFGYENGAPNVIEYGKDGQTIIVQKDAPQQLINEYRSQGVKVRRSNYSLEDGKKLTNTMKKEASLTKNASKNSKVVPQVYKTKEIISNCHKSGVKGAGKAAAFGGGLSLGSNIVDIARGEKEIGEATIDIAKDTAVAAGVGYAATAATTAIASTATGAAVVTQIGVAATTVASTTVGASVVGASLGASAAISGATATVIGTAAAGTVVGAAAIAAAPVVIAGAVIGGIFKMFRK